MIGTIVALVLFIYALNIERLWMNELARGGSGLGAWDPATGHGEAGEAGAVKRRWLHSHNDEMRGKDALVSLVLCRWVDGGGAAHGRRSRWTSGTARSRSIRGSERHRQLRRL